MVRSDGRRDEQLRPVTITPGVQAFAEGSALIEVGLTRVLCTVSVEEAVPAFLRGAGKGWITAEYGMLPRSTLTRTPRESSPRGRTHEIQRLIGRSLRAVADLEVLEERTLTVDCDVLQADGGTRTAAVTGAYVALYQALSTLKKRKKLEGSPLRAAVAATSVGVLGGRIALDLCYEEDSRAEADFNVVMTDQGRFVEVQGTGEEATFSRETLDRVLLLAEQGIRSLFQAQTEAIAKLS
jgi:ribonuclease PH